MSAPTCRACYAATLTNDERQRFYAEPVTSCIYWCADHARAEALGATESAGEGENGGLGGREAERGCTGETRGNE